MPVDVEQPRTEPAISPVPAKPRRWLAIAFVVALTVAFLLPYALVRQPHDTGEVRLPDRIEGYSVITGNASTEPPGRSVIAFESGNGSSQLLAVGVDGRTYRSVEPANGILSPDGTSMLQYQWEPDRPITGLSLFDLRTGSTRTVPVPASAALVVYAWSPDGRLVAFGHLPGLSRQYPLYAAAEAGMEVRAAGTLSVLDLTTESIVDYPALSKVTAAAFAPDSRTLAVQADSRILIVDGSGAVQREIPRPSRDRWLKPGVAWSPDGRWLALVLYNELDLVNPHPPSADLPMIGPQRDFTMERSVMLVDAVSGRPGPWPAVTVPWQLLGWRDAETMVGWTGAAVFELSLRDGHTTDLARFTQRKVCGTVPFFEPCMTFGVVAATGLLPSLRVVPAESPIRGRWQLRWPFIGVVVGLGLVTLVAVRIRRRLALRRPQASSVSSVSSAPQVS